jgi:hypothetical protein
MEGVLPEVIPYLIKRLDQLYGVNALPLPIPSDDGGVYSGRGLRTLVSHCLFATGSLDDGGSRNVLHRPTRFVA